jgi:hypothetical protein
MINLILISFVLIFTSFFLNDCDSTLIVKWLTPDTLLNLRKQPLKLIRNTTFRDRDKPMGWYKYNENAFVNSVYNKMYVCQTTSTSFNLLISEYDINTHLQLDYYKPMVLRKFQEKNFDLINVRSNLNDGMNLIYTFIYLKELKLEKYERRIGEYEFNCSATLLVAEHDDAYAELSEFIIDFLRDHVHIEVDVSDAVEMKNGKKEKSSSSLKSIFKNIYKQLSSKKRDIHNMKRPIEYIVSYPLVQIYKTANEKRADFTCNLALLNDDKSIEFAKTINKPINYLRSSSPKLVEFSYACVFLYFFIVLI